VSLERWDAWLQGLGDTKALGDAPSAAEIQAEHDKLEQQKRLEANLRLQRDYFKTAPDTLINNAQSRHQNDIHHRSSHHHHHTEAQQAAAPPAAPTPLHHISWAAGLPASSAALFKSQPPK
jgi:hypothetical protein